MVIHELETSPTFFAYRHADGRIGIRNDLWLVRRGGATVLTGPGNDLVASTVLAAAGCHLILFTTGRGTPFGCVVPTLKISTNDALAQNKPHWIDWNAMSNPDTDAFAQKVLAIASGRERAKNEICGAHGIAIFKTGVTL